MKRTPTQWVAKVIFAPVDLLEHRAATAIAILVLLAAATIGYLGTCHFDGVIDIHVGLQTPLWFHLVEVFIAWLSMGLSLSLWAALLLPTRPALRTLYLGQALARAPFVLASVVALVPSFQAFTRQVTEVLSRIEEGSALESTDLPGMHWGVAFMGVMTAWFVALAYRAFAGTGDAPMRRRLLTFVLAIVTAEIAVKLALSALAQLL
jgi:hypothetical protein